MKHNPYRFRLQNGLHYMGRRLITWAVIEQMAPAVFRAYQKWLQEVRP